MTDNPYNKKIVVIFFLLILFNLVNAQVSDTLNSPGIATWIVPCGVFSIDVEVWGAGGAGGSSTNRGGGGGGGGCYSSQTISVTPGQIINYTIGAGGSAVPLASGSNGGASAFSTIVAGGGIGGGLGTTTDGLPGSGCNTGFVDGSSGAFGSSTSGGNGGAGANGGTGGLGGGLLGGNGNLPGAGGGGGYSVGVTNGVGGNGAGGRVVVRYIVSPFSASIIGFTDILCFGENTGIASAQGIGGSGAYNFTWSSVPAQSTSTATGLAAGVYTVTVSESNFCTSSTASVTISSPATSVSATITSSSDVFCAGETTGSATVTAGGGTGALSYLWNTIPAQTTATATGLGIGSYTVTVTDQNNCIATASVVISNISTLGIPTVTANGPLSFCTGDSVILSSSPAANYLWSNGETTQSIIVSTSGVFAVSVTDGLCTVSSASITVTAVPFPSAPVINVVTNPTCNTFGSVTLTGLPAIGSWTITESINGNTITGSGTSAVFSGLDEGIYNFTVVSDPSCSSVPSIDVELFPPLSNGPVIEYSFDVVYCHGDSTGIIDVTLAGGTAPLTFVWSNGATSLNLSNLPAGIYSITVTDAVGCTVSASIDITEPAQPLSTTTSVSGLLCFGTGTASATANPSGGTGSYYYSWSNGEFTQTINSLNSGTYIVTVTDDFGCTVVDSVTVIGPASPLTVSISSQNNVLCFGDFGSATVSAIGGVGSYVFDWSNGELTSTATALNIGIHQITVTDDNACQATTSVTITGPSSAISTSVVSQNNVNCFGESNGAVTLSVSGGTPNYFYNWSNGATTLSVTGLIAGTYTVTVSDDNSCLDPITIIISEPSTALVVTLNTSANLCFGDSIGVASSVVNGGTAAYDYLWSNGSTAANLTSLSAGTYNLTVTDNNGCTTTGSGVVSQPVSPLSIALVSQTDELCFGDLNGAAEVIGSGGTGFYIYDWSDGQLSATAVNLAASIYTASVTDENNCIAVTTVTINGQTGILSASITAQINISCFGDAGSATVTPTNGSGLYNYLWNTTPAQTTATATGLSTGIYTVTVSDANGCSTTVLASVTITGPSVPLSSSITAQTNILCFGESNGSATVSASGGSSAYNYSWNSIPAQTTATATGLSTGIYSVTVTDANGCTSAISSGVTVTGPSNVLSASITAQNNIICFGDNIGSATVTSNGGSLAYNYIWNTIPAQNSTTATGLTAGTYTVTVSDNNGCTASVNASVTITAPSSVLTAAIGSQSNVLCFGAPSGSATVIAGGGSLSYNYIWNTVPVQNTVSATGLSAGIYSVTVTDNNGCTAAQSASVTITGPSAALTVAIGSQTNSLCFGQLEGAATVSASGGSSSYNYFWSTVPAQNAVTATGLSPGVYTVTVTDANGCTAAQTASVTISGPALPLSSSIASQTNVLCFGETTGSATVNAAGGSLSYSYLWNTIPTQSSAIATGLSAGTYIVTVSDANGCTSTIQSSVTITGQPTAISVLTNQTNILCFGQSSGSATAVASGGSSVYNYLWNTIPVQNTATATGLITGSYTVSVTDQNGCSVTSTANLTITEPSSALSVSITGQTNVSCFADANGSATVTATGGTNLYTYLWNIVPAQNTSLVTGLNPGVYAVTVTDANGCTVAVTASVTITGPASALSVVMNSPTNVLCFGESTGNANITASGGSLSYNYLWNTIPAQTTATATGLAAGNYTVTVTDINGCTISLTSSTSINQPLLPLSASISGQTNVLCFGDLNGSAVVTANGGTFLYSYLWNTIPAQTSSLATGLTAGNYTVTVSDQNGCTATASATSTITGPSAPLSVAVISQNNNLCFAETNGAVTVSAAGGSGAYNFIWGTIPARTTAAITGLTAGVYSVTVSDQNSCSVTVVESVTITGPSAPLSSNISSQTNISCFGDVNGSASVTALGGSSAYTYLWNTLPAQTTATATGLVTGNYSVTVSDASGCSITSVNNVTISGPLSALSATFSQINVLCSGNSNGSATVLATGGTLSYNYNWSTIPAQTTATATGLVAGSYTVTLTDANGCTVSVINSITITEPSTALSTIVIGQTNVLCFGENTGTATVQGLGGTSVYNYIWSTFPAQTSATATGLTVGNYFLTVTDANGCPTSVISAITITGPSSSLAANISLQTNVLCFNGNNGLSNVMAFGGSGFYNYIWSTIPAQTSLTATGLTAGTYTVTVSDANGCTATTNTSVTITGPSAPLTAFISNQTNVLCFGDVTGSATVLGGGGSGSYSYLWNTSPVQTTITATGLGAGTYTVSVTDLNGCSISSTATVTIIGPFSAISAPISNQSNVICFGGSSGSATVSPSGGSGIFNFLWNSTPVQNTATATGLGVGIYSVTVSDQNGCNTIVVSFVSITQAAQLSAPVIDSITQPTCSVFLGSVYLSNLPAGAWTITESIGGTTISGSGSSAVFSGLASGSYQFTYTNFNSCISAFSSPAVINNNSAADCDGDGVSNGTEVTNGTNTLDPCNYLTASVTLPQGGLWLLADCDGDGVINGTEITDGTNPNIPCSYNPSSVTLPQGASWSGFDCDGDGVLNSTETADATDPTNPCVYLSSSITLSQGGLWNIADCDGDGVVNLTELADGTNPNNSCNYLLASITVPQTGLWTIADCDGDGVINGTEVTDATNLNNPCSYLSGSITLAQSGAWSSADCDGDGVINGTELSDGTNPANSCNYNNTSITLAQTGAWNNADCDGDGVTNGTEISNGTNQSNPCSYLVSSVTLPQGGAWNPLDCDGDGVINSTEVTDSTNPNNPCSFISSSITLAQTALWNNSDCDGDGVINSIEVLDSTNPVDPCSFELLSISLIPSVAWNSLDCDGDGVTNSTEIAGGTNPTNPCSFIPANITLTQGGQWNLVDCDGDGVINVTEIADGTLPNDFCSFDFLHVTLVQSAAFNISDCDGDGVINSVEVADGTNPTAPCEYIAANVSSVQGAAWNTVDCDGDGVINGTEVTDNTDELNPCDFVLSNVTLPQGGNWNAFDCDGDAVVNSTEITDGTDPNNFCSFLLSSATVLPSSAWSTADCDGDGVVNGTEITDLTIVTDPCSFVTASITLAQGGAWNAVDCDGDGVVNGTELLDATDPTVACSFDILSVTLATSPAWNATDCDGDGVLNATEITDNTDLLDPCDFITASITLIPGGNWNTVDCDGDGVINGTEVSDSTNPNNPCSFLTASITVTQTVAWNTIDCDGDGVVNGTEVSDNTNPNDPCEYINANVTLAQSGIWNAADCDGDGVINGTETLDSTDATDPCSFILVNATLTPSIDWTALDCDGDGVTNANELTDASNPVDPCSYDSTSITVAQGGDWNAADCDGDGVINGIEIIDDTNPFEPCDFVLASQSLTPSAVWNDLDCDDDGINNGEEIAQSSDPLDPCSPISCELNIPEGFSPNGDGVNDLYVIRGIKNYPLNEFKVFNRWGNLVYSAKPYDNTWDGRATHGLVIGGEVLPTGVYFYVLDFGDGSKPVKGSIYLNKEN